MSIIPKIWNLCNSNISTVASNFNRSLKCGGTIFQRLLSKRYTIGRDCKKPKPKQIKCEGELSKRRRRKSSADVHKQCPECKTNPPPKPNSKTAMTDVCSPFRKKEKKSKRSKSKKKTKCSAGMQNPCEDVDCTPTCSLTKGERQQTCNECPKDEKAGSCKNCPQGTWEREG